jgi:hypothetical protein
LPTAAEADYQAALERNFGATATAARADKAHNGSRPDHPLHSFFVAKTETSNAWFAEANKATRTAS